MYVLSLDVILSSRENVAKKASEVRTDSKVNLGKMDWLVPQGSRVKPEIKEIPGDVALTD